MVGAVGLTESAKGDLKEKLANLGTNLITVEAGGLVRPAEPDPPQGRGGPGPRGADGGAGLGGQRDQRRGDPAQRRARRTTTRRSRYPCSPPTTRCPTCSRCRCRAVAGCVRAIERTKTRSVVIGAGLADQYGYVPGEIRTITLNGIDYGVVGVLDRVALDPNLDNAAFVTQ